MAAKHSNKKGGKTGLVIIAIVLIIALATGAAWYFSNKETGQNTPDADNNTAAIADGDQTFTNQILQFEGDVVEALTYNNMLLVNSYDAGLDTASARSDLYGLYDFRKLGSQNLGTGDYNINLYKNGFYVISRTENKLTLYNGSGEKAEEKLFNNLPEFSRVGALSRDGTTLLSYDAKECRLYLTNISTGKTAKLDGRYTDLSKAEPCEDGFSIIASNQKTYFVNLKNKSVSLLYSGKNITCNGAYFGLGTTDYNFEIVKKDKPVYLSMVTVDEYPIGLGEKAFATQTMQTANNIVRVYDLENKERRDYNLTALPESVVFAGTDAIVVTGGSDLRHHNVRALSGEVVKQVKIDISTSDGNTLYSKNEVIKNNTAESSSQAAEQPAQPTSDDKEKAVIINAPNINQNPEYPTGCESVATVMALKYAGHNVTVGKFIDSYLTKSSSFYMQDGKKIGPDPYKAFIGNPRSNASYGCMAPVIETACQKAGAKVENTTGMPLSDLCANYIDKKSPVIIWATIDMEEKTSGSVWYLEDGSKFVWPKHEHCLLLVGYDDDYYYINDPMKGATVKYKKTVVEQRYGELGMQSLVVK